MEEINASLQGLKVENERLIGQMQAECNEKVEQTEIRAEKQKELEKEQFLREIDLIKTEY